MSYVFIGTLLNVCTFKSVSVLYLTTNMYFFLPKNLISLFFARNCVARFFSKIDKLKLYIILWWVWNKLKKCSPYNQFDLIMCILSTFSLYTEWIKLSSFPKHKNTLNFICIPMTFNNPLKAYFFSKKYSVTKNKM